MAQVQDRVKEKHEEPLGRKKKDSTPDTKLGMNVRRGPRDESDLANVELILQVKRGMSENQVIAILGPPHQIQENVLDAIPALNQPRRVTVIWTYNPNSKNFMVFSFENGTCQGGESGGYDIEKGLTIPDNIKNILHKGN